LIDLNNYTLRSPPFLGLDSVLHELCALKIIIEVFIPKYPSMSMTHWRPGAVRQRRIHVDIYVSPYVLHQPPSSLWRALRGTVPSFYVDPCDLRDCGPESPYYVVLTETGDWATDDCAVRKKKISRNPSGTLEAMNKVCPFKYSANAKEGHNKQIYCVSWSADLYKAEGDEEDYVQCLAVCGANNLTIYEVVPHKGVDTNTIKNDQNDQKRDSSDRRLLNNKVSSLNVRQAYIDEDEDENFFCCSFGGRGINVESFRLEAQHRKIEVEDDTSENKVIRIQQHTEWNLVDTDAKSRYFHNFSDLSSNDGPQLLCVAGKRGIVKVIDTTRRCLLQTLCGHGNEINDLKFSHTDEWILVTCSKDESLRLWNLQTATCIAVLAGHNGHRDSVLSASFSEDNKFIASGGMDTSVKLWNLDIIHDAIANSFHVKPRSLRNEGNSVENSGNKRCRQALQPLLIQTPYFSTKKVHNDYVDCVSFVGDLILSRCCATNNIVLWKPQFSSSSSSPSALAKDGHKARMEDKVLVLREFSLKHCEIWFVRFDVCLKNLLLAFGNTRGEVKIWQLTSKGEYLLSPPCSAAVRVVSLSPDGNYLVAACDDATIYKWDASTII
jgi:polycomb protein EED